MDTGASNDSDRALVVVANRLPVEYDDETGWRPAPGGLVTAMESVLRDREALWIGWSGRFEDPDAEETPPPPTGAGNMVLDEVPLTRAEVEGYYEGCSNGAIWPLYHDAIVAPVYHRHAVRDVSAGQREVRQAGRRDRPARRPWCGSTTTSCSWCRACCGNCDPTCASASSCTSRSRRSSCSAQLPWRRQMLEGLLGADLVGFQTKEAALNFLRLVHRFLALAARWRPRRGGRTVGQPHGPGRGVPDRHPVLQDFASLAAEPATRAWAEQIREDLGKPDLILLGVDRLDYTKGIDVRIRAVTELFEDGELEPESTVFVQVATPSRENVEEYQRIRDDVELLVSRANGDLGKLGVTPIHYLHQPMARDELDRHVRRRGRHAGDPACATA